MCVALLDWLRLDGHCFWAFLRTMTDCFFGTSKRIFFLSCFVFLLCFFLLEVALVFVDLVFLVDVFLSVQYSFTLRLGMSVFLFTEVFFLVLKGLET
jgi:hypothetical protein